MESNERLGIREKRKMGKFFSGQSVLFFKMKVKKRESYSFVLFLLRSLYLFGFFDFIYLLFRFFFFLCADFTEYR